MKNKDIFTFRDAEKQAGPVAFSTMLKPAGSACNLDCHYCYYLDKAVQYGGRQAVMSDELLELYVKQYIEANEVPTVQFCWHGGEPLLLGVDFYRKAMDFQQKYADGKKIENILQTNGTLVDEAWCDLFAGNNFLVGISLDGPQDIHDAFRLTKGGRPTFERVMRTIEMFQRSGVEYNTLSVVNRLCEGRGGEIYRFFRDTVHSRYMQFLPAVEHVVDKPGFHRPLIVSPDREGARLAEWSVTAKGYGGFLCDVFDVWVVSDVGRTFVSDVRRDAGPVVRRAPGRLLDGRDVRRRAGRRAQRRRLFVRPLRLSRIQVGQHPRNAVVGDLPFAQTGGFRPCQAQCAARRMPAVQILFRLPGRMSETPLRDRFRRLPQELALRGIAALVPPFGTLHGVHARHAGARAVPGVGHALRPQAHGADVAPYPVFSVFSVFCVSGAPARAARPMRG